MVNDCIPSLGLFCISYRWPSAPRHKKFSLILSRFRFLASFLPVNSCSHVGSVELLNCGLVRCKFRVLSRLGKDSLFFIIAAYLDSSNVDSADVFCQHDGILSGF